MGFSGYGLGDIQISALVTANATSAAASTTIAAAKVGFRILILQCVVFKGAAADCQITLGSKIIANSLWFGGVSASGVFQTFGPILSSTNEAMAFLTPGSGAAQYSVTYAYVPDSI